MTIFKYLAREILLATLTVTLVVLVIAISWRFSGYLREAAGGSFTSSILFTIMLFRVPGLLELIVPLGFFLGIMLAYGRLYVDSEMVVLEACGVSPARLVGVTMSLAVVIAGITALNSMWLKPSGVVKLEKLFENQRGLTEFDTLAPGRFQMLNSGRRVTYTERLDAQGNLAGVFMDELKGPEQPGPRSVHTIHAQSGSQQVDEKTGDRFLVLRDGTRYSGAPGALNYQVIEYQELGQLISREDATRRNIRSTAMSTLDLWRNPGPRNTPELQWRISIVLLVFVMALLAVPLSRVNPRQGRFSRMVPGLGLSFLYVMLLSATRSSVERQEIPVEIGLWWVHVLFLVICWMLFKAERMRLQL